MGIMNEIDIMVKNQESPEEIAKVILSSGNFDGNSDEALRCAIEIIKEQ
jgi:hypothetical protein